MSAARSSKGKNSRRTDDAAHVQSSQVTPSKAGLLGQLPWSPYVDVYADSSSSTTSSTSRHETPCKGHSKRKKSRRRDDAAHVQSSQVTPSKAGLLGQLPWSPYVDVYADSSSSTTSSTSRHEAPCKGHSKGKKSRRPDNVAHEHSSQVTPSKAGLLGQLPWSPHRDTYANTSSSSNSSINMPKTPSQSHLLGQLPWSPHVDVYASAAHSECSKPRQRCADGDRTHSAPPKSSGSGSLNLMKKSKKSRKKRRLSLPRVQNNDKTISNIKRNSSVSMSSRKPLPKRSDDMNGIELHEAVDDMWGDSSDEAEIDKSYRRYKHSNNSGCEAEDRDSDVMNSDDDMMLSDEEIEASRCRPSRQILGKSVYDLGLVNSKSDEVKYFKTLKDLAALEEKRVAGELNVEKKRAAQIEVERLSQAGQSTRMKYQTKASVKKYAKRFNNDCVTSVMRMAIACMIIWACTCSAVDLTTKRVYGGVNRFTQLSRDDKRDFVDEQLDARVDRDGHTTGRCDKCWMQRHGVPPSTFYKRKAKYLRNTLGVLNRHKTKGKKIGKLTIAGMECRAWLSRYVKRHGDQMPDQVCPSNHKTCINMPWSNVTTFWNCYVRRMDKMEVPFVKYCHFSRTLRTHYPHVKFPAVARFSKCPACKEFKRRKEEAKDANEYEIIEIDKEEHIHYQGGERCVYWNNRSYCRDNPHEAMSMIVDAMDNNTSSFPRERIPNADLNGCVPIKTHVTGVLVHGRYPYAMNYTWYSQFPSDYNIVIHAVNRTLMQMDTLPPVLFLQLDNCTRENKNRFLMFYLALLVKEGVFQKVYVNFLQVGHTHEDVDQMFSRISEYLKDKNIYSIVDLIRCLKKSFTCVDAPKEGPRQMQHEHISDLPDYRTWFESAMPEQWEGIMSCRSFKFGWTSDGKLRMWHKKDMQGERYLPTNGDVIDFGDYGVLLSVPKIPLNAINIGKIIDAIRLFLTIEQLDDLSKLKTEAECTQVCERCFDLRQKCYEIQVHHTASPENKAAASAAKKALREELRAHVLSMAGDKLHEEFKFAPGEHLFDKHANKYGFDAKSTHIEKLIVEREGSKLLPPAVLFSVGHSLPKEINLPETLAEMKLEKGDWVAAWVDEAVYGCVYWLVKIESVTNQLVRGKWYLPIDEAEHIDVAGKWQVWLIGKKGVKGGRIPEKAALSLENIICKVRMNKHLDINRTSFKNLYRYINHGNDVAVYQLDNNSTLLSKHISLCDSGVAESDEGSDNDSDSDAPLVAFDPPD
jgi:hypothetical protein